MRQIRVLLGLVALAVAVNCQGCQIFPYWMQPSRLWKLNRQPAMDEGYSSVSDPAHPPVIVAPANHDADLYPAQ